MRTAMTAALLAAAMLSVSGCFGGDEHGEFTCPDGTVLHEKDFEHHDEEGFDIADECPGPTGGSPTPTPTAPPRPNELPVLRLTVTDDAGNATNVTSVGGNLTFSAAGSTDPDGTLVGAAIILQDSNQTRSAPLLVGGQFVPAAFNLDRPGIANVTVNLIDERAGFTVARSHVFVNHPQALGSHEMRLGAPGLLSADDCQGTAAGDIIDANYYKEFGFDVLAGATYIEAFANVTGEQAPSPAPQVPYAVELAICAPDGTALSAAGDGSATSTNEAPLAAPADPTKPYYVAAVGQTPNIHVEVSVVVHYEPRPAAAA